MSDDQDNVLGDRGNGGKIVRQNLSLGRSKNVAVEIKRKKKPTIGGFGASAAGSMRKSGDSQQGGGLTNAEMEDRLQAVKRAMAAQAAEQAAQAAKLAREKEEQERRAKEDQERRVQEALKAKNEAVISKEVIEKTETYRPTTPRYERPTGERFSGERFQRRQEGAAGAQSGRSFGSGYRDRNSAAGSDTSSNRGPGGYNGGYRDRNASTGTGGDAPYKKFDPTRKRFGDDNRGAHGAAGHGPKKPYNNNSAPTAPLNPDLELEEHKRKAEFSKKDKDKRNKKFAETGAVAADANRFDNKRQKNLNLSRYRDIGNIDEAYDQGRAWLKKRAAKDKKSLDDGDFIQREVVIPKTIAVSELANRMAIRSSDVIKKLMQQGMFVTVNQIIDGDIAELICLEFGHTPKRVSEEDVEKVLTQTIDASTLKERAPVVTVMGHVDHGKTSLLDALRDTSVVKGEAGGITQHIGAYRIFTKQGKPIVFIDTPGHAAFSSMRARGANITDIVVLVVAADDGVKAQTVEAIQHAKSANVPMIVAVNKMDLPDANSQRVISELLAHDVVAESFGGQVMIAEISAKSRMGLDKLEEAILLLAETLELKASPEVKAKGVVIESTQEKGRGSMATVLVQEGVLRVGEVFVVGKTYGKIKLMLDEFNKEIKEAGPSTPVRILGLDGIPEAGDVLNVTESEQTAIEIAESRSRREKEEQEAKKVKAGGLEGFLQNVADSEVKVLPVIIKADVHGSAEAIKQSLEKLSDENVRVNILHAAVGPISENDVTLAKAGHGVIIGFNVRANTKARDIAKQDNVEILYHSIIYKVIEDIQNIMKGFLKPVFRDKFIGYAEIRQVFNVTKTGKVAGCMVTEGTVQRGAKVRLLRDNIVIHEGKLKTLRRFKEEVKEVKHGYECGIAFENYDDIRVGDIVECSVEEEVK